jgi:hypothetical protein
MKISSGGSSEPQHVVVTVSNNQITEVTPMSSMLQQANKARLVVKMYLEDEQSECSQLVEGTFWNLGTSLCSYWTLGTTALKGMALCATSFALGSAACLAIVFRKEITPCLEANCGSCEEEDALPDGS